MRSKDKDEGRSRGGRPGSRSRKCSPRVRESENSGGRMQHRRDADQLGGPATGRRSISHRISSPGTSQSSRRRHGATAAAVVDRVSARTTTILVTERGGQLRIIRNGVLDPAPVAGTPAVHASGLQGLMDVVLHPRFAGEPLHLSRVPQASEGADGSRGGRNDARTRVWNGTALTDVRDIFASGATNTESSRIGFGRDGMLYMTISASGTGPDVFRSADPNDYAGKTVRLQRRRHNPAGQPVRRQSLDTSRGSTRSAIATVTRCRSTPRPGRCG